MDNSFFCFTFVLLEIQIQYKIISGVWSVKESNEGTSEMKHTIETDRWYAFKGMNPNTNVIMIFICVLSKLNKLVDVKRVSTTFAKNNFDYLSENGDLTLETRQALKTLINDFTNVFRIIE